MWDIVDVINAVAKARGVSGAQVALAWLLQRPLVASVLVGGRSLAQFEDSLKAADLKLSNDDVAALDKVSQLPLLYPYWHQSYTGTQRMSPPDLALHQPYVGQPLGKGVH